MKRRAFLAATAAAMAPIGAAPEARKRLGLTIASYRRYRSEVASRRFPGWKDALEVLDHCAELGAGCLQIGVRGWTGDFAGKVRERRERHGILLEGQVGLPKDEHDLERFRQDCRAAREAGATVLRTVCLGGRRYEAFASADEWDAFRKRSWTSLTLAEPVARTLGLKLAIENHKDWRADELLDLLRRLSSEAVGVTFDFGNSLALLEDPHILCEALAPHIFTTHVKDMGVQPCEDGFLLSEVRLGEGLLDLPRLLATCARHNPAVQFNLEMITRDPLLVPVLTEKYWATMRAVPAAELARTMKLVRDHPPAQPLPRVAGKSPEERLAYEDENVRRCFAFARAELGL